MASHSLYFSVIANIFYLWLKQILDTCSLCTHRSLTMSPMFFLSLAFSAACSTAVAEECNAILQTDLRSASGMMSRLDFKHALENKASKAAKLFLVSSTKPPRRIPSRSKKRSGHKLGKTRIRSASTNFGMTLRLQSWHRRLRPRSFGPCGTGCNPFSAPMSSATSSCGTRVATMPMWMLHVTSRSISTSSQRQPT